MCTIAQRAAGWPARVGFAAALALAASGWADAAVVERGASCGPTDLVIVLDDTGSMGRAIADVKGRIDELLDAVDRLSGGRFQLGLVTFSDRIEVDLDLGGDPSPTLRKARMREVIRRLQVGGGGQGPEASDEALNTVVNRLEGRGRAQDGDFDGRFAGASRIVVLITDQLPGGFDDRFTEGLDDANAARRASQARAAGIRISTINVAPHFVTTPMADTLEAIMRRYALETGGMYVVPRHGDRGTAESILRVLRACGAQPLS